MIKQQERDYQISLTGKLPSFNCVVPESLTGETFVNIQNQITKSTLHSTQKPISSKSQSSRNLPSTQRKSWLRILNFWPI